MKDSTFMDIAGCIAKESKCVSWQVGAIIVKDDRIVSTGYNGTPKGHINCCDKFSREQFPKLWEYHCPPSRYKLTPAGRQEHHEWSLHNEIHAELNAILFAAKQGISIDGATMYITITPCKDCAKAITQSGIKRVVYGDVYDKCLPEWDKILKDSGVIVEQLNRGN